MSGLSRAVLALAILGDPGSPLRIERAIALPNVAGRIDHLAIDARDELRTD